jgi:hypothetical protein
LCKRGWTWERVKRVEMVLRVEKV